MIIFAFHTVLAMLLFFLVNWIGKHAVDFGYVSTTLFEEPNESVALNFFLRALSPAVFIIAVSAFVVAAGYPEFRIGIYGVAFYYYLIRAAIILLLNRQHLISWPRYFGHAVVGIAAAIVAYRYLILPNRSLLPNLDLAGNELWLAIFAFLYAVANKISLSSGPGARRRNKFISVHYYRARQRFGQLINSKIPNQLPQLTAYAILIYEDYCRPPAVREAERLMWWKPIRTTGVMQVAADHALSDQESVERGTDLLITAWDKHERAGLATWEIVRNTIADYNRDEDYIERVLEVMDILAIRVEPAFEPSYREAFY